MEVEHATNAETWRKNFNFRNMIFVATEIEHADPITMFSKIGQYSKPSSLIVHKLLSYVSTSIEKFNAIDSRGLSQKALEI